MPAMHISHAKKLGVILTLSSLGLFVAKLPPPRSTAAPASPTASMNGEVPRSTTISTVPAADEVEVDKASTPLDHLRSARTVAEQWLDTVPDAAGMRRRVRIAAAPGTEELIRVEEQVAATARVTGAMAAGHILASSRHTAVLAREGLAVTPAKNPAYVRVKIADAADPAAIPALIARLQARGVTDVTADGFAVAAGLPGDPDVGAGLAWHLENLGLMPGYKAGADIGAPAAWEHRTDARPVIIALLDGGILHGEPELAEALHHFPGETAGDGTDDDGNGYVDDVQGYDFVNDDADPSPETMHGTACAALIGGRGGNGVLSSGVAWKASILNCKVFNHTNLGSLSDIIDAIDYSIASGARIINLSWTYDAPSPLLEQALARANAAGVIIVCAAGNRDHMNPLAATIPLPGALDLPLSVTVAASGPDDTLAPLTAVNPNKVDLAAPGVNLPLRLAGEGSRVDYIGSTLTGSSFSTALVSGSLALTMAEHPEESPQQIVRRLLETVDPIPGGAAMLSTGGRLNLGRMMTAELPEVAHDDFADRRLLSDPAGQWTGGNAAATTEPADLAWALKPAPARTLWFEWTAAYTGTLTISASSTPAAGASLRVFRESAGQPSALAGQFLKGKPLAIAVTRGQKLFWMLDSTSPLAGGLRVSWQLPPPNDSLANAPTITRLPAVLTGSTLGATPDKFEKKKYHALYFPGQSIWWKFTPDRDMEAVVTVSGENCMAYLVPLKGKSASFSKTYHYLNSPYQIVPLEAGQPYAVLAVPATLSSGGDVTLSLTEKSQQVLAGQPQDVAALPGETTGFAVRLLGHHNLGLPEIQWFKDDQPVPAWLATSFTVTPESYGTYHAVLTRGGVSETTRKAVLSRRAEAPRLVEAPREHRFIHDQSLELAPRFADTANTTFAWQKDGQPLPGESGPRLDRRRLTAADSGRYTVIATNGSGTTEADFDVAVLETPWQHWTVRGSGIAERGAILEVGAEGSVTTALTASAWLRSTDGGATWTPEALPDHFTATCGAGLADGTLLVSGSSFAAGEQSPEAWRKSPGGEWTRTTVSAVFPDGETRSVQAERVFSFDGKFYVTGSSRVLASSDGLTWTVLTRPGQPTQALEATAMHRFPDALVIRYWGTSSSQPALALKAGGVQEILPDLGYRDVWQFDGVFRTDVFSHTGEFIDMLTGSDTVMRGLTENGHLVSCLSTSLLTHKNLYFRCSARSGNRWVIGYHDGTIWSGENLFEAPSGTSATSATDLTAFADEFISGDRQSSDGTHWQPLGPVSGKIIARGGDRFFLRHAVPLRHAFDADASAETPFSETVHPMAEVGDSTLALSDSNFWSGNDAVLRTRTRYGNSNPAHIVQFYRPGPTGTTVQDCDIGIDWLWMHGATQAGTHWYLNGSAYTFDVPFLVRSTDGVSWQRMNLMPGYKVSGSQGFHVASGYSCRGFTSPDGTRWKPLLMRGLPAAPDQVVAYRGHHVARVDKQLYVSANGSEWHLGSTGVPIAKLAANRHGILALTTDGRLLQPDHQTSSGPWLRLPHGYQSLAVPRHQPAVFDVEAGDDDGDLESVTCFVDGKPAATLHAAPFRFGIDTSEAASRAIEFVARDQAGRISRTTALLKVLPLGVLSSTPVVLEPTPDRLAFKGKLYTRNGPFQSIDGDEWESVGPAGFGTATLVANDRALLIYNGNGIAVSQDGSSWTILNGFKAINGIFSVEVHGNVFELKTEAGRWVSEDGLTWQPATGLFHETGVVWCDPLHGLAGSGNTWQTTHDGGRNWVRIPTTVFGGHSGIFPVSEGFIIVAANGSTGIPGIRFLRKGEFAFSTLIDPPNWESAVFLQSAGDRVFFGIHNASLFSTADGLTITPHTWPPNLLGPKFVRHGGEWLALSLDGFYASPDLATWRLIFATQQVGDHGGSLPSSGGVTVSPHGHGAIIVSAPSSYYFSNRSVVIAADLTASVWPYRFRASGEPTNTLSGLPGAEGNGAFFKDRVIAVGTFLHTKPAGVAAPWERADLLQGDGFTPPTPHEWPDRYNRYHTTRVYAASDSRFVMLMKPYDRRVDIDVVIHSDDGKTFRVNAWNAPVNLDAVTTLTASSDTFLANGPAGTVLQSTDGFNWTSHVVTTPDFVINTIHHFGGRWHVAGYHPHVWTGSATIPGWSEIWSSTDGQAWQKTWEDRTPLYSSTGSFSEAFSAHGKSWLKHSKAGWIKTTDGLSWQVDEAAKGLSMYTGPFQAKGGHPDGIFATHNSGYGKVFILHPETWKVVRTLDFRGTAVRWIEGWPFLRTSTNLVEWTEADPRLTAISASAPAATAGSQLTIDLAAAELDDAMTLRFSLSDDAFTGPPGDLEIAAAAWSAGTLQPDGSRRFTAVVPAGLAAGNYRVVAHFNVDGVAGDIGLQNNILATASPVLTVPADALPAFAATTSSPDGGWSGDPDGDGLSTWHEYLFGSDPTTPSGNGLTVAKESDCLKLTYQRPAGLAPDSLPVPEYGTGLGNWTETLPDGSTHRVVSAANGIETVEITIPFSSGATGFIRLRLPLPPAEP